MPDSIFNPGGILFLGVVYGVLILSNVVIWFYKRPLYRVRVSNILVETRNFDEAERLLRMATQSFLMQERPAAPVPPKAKPTDEVANVKR